MTTTICKIDWLRWTCPAWVALSDAVPMRRAFLVEDYEIRPLPNYTAAIKLKCGRVDKNTRDETTGQMVTLSVRDLDNARVLGVTDTDLLAHIVKLKAHTTRIDLAIDIRDEEINISGVYAAGKKGKIQTNAEKLTRWSSVNAQGREGVTRQIGSRASEQVLRVADKSAEQNESGEWVRIELEIKGDAADRAVATLHTSTDHASTIKSAIATYAMVPRAWYKRAVSHETPTDCPPISRKDTEWETWVYKTALPNIEKALRRDTPNVRKTIEKILSDIDKS